MCRVHFCNAGNQYKARQSAQSLLVVSIKRQVPGGAKRANRQ